MRKVFPTGQVAKICKVAPRTVSKWFDSGRLRGYRIPGSQDRRIPREHLVRFLKEHGMPLGELEDEVIRRVLVVDPRADQMVGRLREMLSSDEDFRIEAAASGFEAGLKAEQVRPDCVLINLDVGGMDGRAIADNLRQNPNFQNTVLIALVNQGQMIDPAELRVRGFDDFYTEPLDMGLVAERIRNAILARKG